MRTANDVSSRAGLEPVLCPGASKGRGSFHHQALAPMRPADAGARVGRRRAATSGTDAHGDESARAWGAPVTRTPAHGSGLPSRSCRTSLAISARTWRRAQIRSLRSIASLPDASPRVAAAAACPRQGGGAGRAHQKGSRLLVHDAITFGPVQLVIQRVIRSSFPMGAAMEQIPLRLLCRLDAPSGVPPGHIDRIRSYREAVKFCWEQRRVRNMTKAQLAERAGLYASHVSGYLIDGKRQRDLPGNGISGFQLACGNTAISQWLAHQAQLTVLEELQAERNVA